MSSRVLSIARLSQRSSEYLAECRGLSGVSSTSIARCAIMNALSATSRCVLDSPTEFRPRFIVERAGSASRMSGTSSRREFVASQKSRTQIAATYVLEPPREKEAIQKNDSDCVLEGFLNRIIGVMCL